MNFSELPTDIWLEVSSHLSPRDVLGLVCVANIFLDRKNLLYKAADIWRVSIGVQISITDLLEKIKRKLAHINTICIVDTTPIVDKFVDTNIIFNYYSSIYIDDEEYTLGIVIIEYDQYANLKSPFDFYDRTHKYISKFGGYWLTYCYEPYSLIRLFNDMKKYRHKILNENAYEIIRF